LSGVWCYYPRHSSLSCATSTGYQVYVMNIAGNPCSCFGVFEFNPQTGELRKQGLRRKLWPQAAEVLALLLERPGKVCTREQLRQRLWPNEALIDFERGINKAVHELRQALGDSAVSPRYIETIIGAGYRFIEISQPPGNLRRLRKRTKIDSMAVLPFATQHTDDDLEFLKRRIIKTLIGSISRSPGVRVQAYRSVQCYCDKDINPRTVGQELLVRAVVAGEITRRNGDVHVDMEAIDVEDGTQLWGGQFTEPFPGILDCPDKLANKICDQLQPVIAPVIEPAA
jgi:DNA-binding winged helix-turn-helix (wHTH) protein